MAVTESDRKSLGVTAEQLQAYLQSNGWREDGHIRSVATIWHRSELGQEEAEILVPTASAKDYRSRLRDALASVVRFEDRNVTDIVADVRRLHSNLISVRVIHQDTADGTIPINDGVILVAKARDLLSSAAQSVYAKKKQFLGKVATETKAYLDTLRLGQTEVGSYVVNVFAPLQIGDSAVGHTSDGQSLAQAITHSLVTGLEALSRATKEFEAAGDYRVFDAAVMSGASSNLCDALIGFSGEDRDRTFEITVTAAAGPLFSSESKRFGFGTSDIKMLEKATGYYKDEYVLSQRRLTGHIRKLSRPKNETSGTVVMQAQIGDAERSIKIELSGDEYHLAVLAHDNSELVRVDGDVHIKSKSAWLLNPTNFGVIRIDDLL